MKIAILGSGGREHALVNQMSLSKKTTKIYCIPGNAGTCHLAENVNLNLDNFESIYDFILKNKIELVVVGPEKPLVDGIADFLQEKKIKVFGPNKVLSQFEGSKTFTKNVCKKYNIPTAKFNILKNLEESIKYLNQVKFPIVIKADGLAAGKGVYICENLEKSNEAVKEIFDGKFGKADQIVIEEFLEGEEMSFFVISDGKSFKQFNTAQDHKRVGEDDTGKNTGGMGAYSPSALINKDLEKKIIDKIIEPTFRAIRDFGEEYIGFLYAGLMIKNNEPFLIEYNVRMGDPECQTILPLLKSDFLDIINACCEQKLNQSNVDWSDKKSLSIVLCSKGYPESYKKNVEIKNLNKIKNDKNNFMFHAGTISKNDKIFANGGRVLNFVSISESYLEARKSAIDKIKDLNWGGGFFRKDIGFKAID